MIRNPPKGTGTVADQLRRAAASIPINIAEGSGRWHKADKQQFFYVCRGSLLESVSAIDIAAGEGLIKPEDKARLRSDLVLISKMLAGLQRHTANDVSRK